MEQVAQQYWKLQGVGTLSKFAREMAEVATELQAVRFNSFWKTSADHMNGYDERLKACVAEGCAKMFHTQATCSLMCQYQVSNPCVTERVPGFLQHKAARLCTELNKVCQHRTIVQNFRVTSVRPVMML